MEAIFSKIATLDGVALRGASEEFAQIENFWVNDVKALLFCYEYHTWFMSWFIVIVPLDQSFALVVCTEK